MLCADLDCYIRGCYSVSLGLLVFACCVMYLLFRLLPDF